MPVAAAVAVGAPAVAVAVAVRAAVAGPAVGVVGAALAAVAVGAPARRGVAPAAAEPGQSTHGYLPNTRWHLLPREALGVLETSLRPSEATHLLASIKISARGLLAPVAKSVASTVWHKPLCRPAPTDWSSPEARDKGVMHATIDRYDVKQYRKFWAAPGLERCYSGRGRKLTPFYRSRT